MTLGEPGKAADTGYKIGVSPVLRAAGPFHRVTNVAVLPSGDMYIADGYGNARVHKFSKEGKLLFSWGEPGRGPGQFILPHAIALDSAGLVYVADRENSRVQIFTPKGEYLREWTFLNRPYDIFIDDQDMLHIAEGGFLNYMHKRAEGPLPGARPVDDLPAGGPLPHRPRDGMRPRRQDRFPGRRGKPDTAGQFHRAARHLGGQPGRHVRRRSRGQRRRGEAHGAFNASRLPEVQASLRLGA